MRHLLYLIGLLFCLLHVDLTHAQPAPTRPDLTKKSLKEVKGMAKNALRLGDTYTALFYYEEWSNRKPNDLDLLYQVAELSRVSRDYAQAELYYSSVSEKDIEKYPLSMFYLGLMQMNLTKYEAAKRNLDEFKKKWARDLKDGSYKKLARAASAGCDLAMESKGDKESGTAAKHLGEEVNHAHIEFSPIILDDTHIIYGSLLVDTLDTYAISKLDSLDVPLRKYYVAELKEDQWISTGELSGPFNEQGKQVGSGAIREDGSRIYFTLCEKNWKGNTICQIYFSDKNGDVWSTPEAMNDMVNLPNYTNTQPAIGKESKKNQEVIYFVSDRPGGKGGLDVWYTEYRERSGEFRAPRNAGSKVNTVGTEFTPFYSIPNRTLYFSSDGHPGIGGLDVFSAVGEKSKFEPAEHLPTEVNSPADDLGLVVAEDQHGGFFVSNRAGGVALLHETCCDDIYEFIYSEFVDIRMQVMAKSGEEQLADFDLKLYIKDKSNIVETDEAVPDYLIKSIQVQGGATTISLPQGKTYILEASKDGYFQQRFELNTDGITRSDTLEHEFDLTQMSAQPITVPGILYEFNSADLTPEARKAIDSTLFRLIVQNPDIIIEIASHTDDKGTELYNRQLSEKRALAVVNHLAIKGIDRSRMRYKGYGESKPIAANTNPDGTDNPEGRRLNRRTEFQVLGRLEPKDILDEDEEEKKPEKKKNDKKDDYRF